MALGCAGRSRALSSPALRGRTCLLPSSLWQVSSCPHIQTWDGLVSQEPVLCPSLRLVQGPHHLSASIQPFRGAWSLSGMMAPLCPHLHQPQLLMHPRSCVAPIYGVCWDSSLIPPTLGASAWSVIASRGRHDVFALPPAKGWQRVSLYLLGMDPPGQPERASGLGAPQRVSLSTRLGHHGLSTWPEGASVSIIALHGPLSTSLLLEQLQLKPREIWRDGAYEGNHALSSLPAQCLDGTTLGSFWSGWGWLCPFLREGSPSCSPSTVLRDPACWFLSSWKS